MGPGGVVWGKKTEYKKSRETVPLKVLHPPCFELKPQRIYQILNCYLKFIIQIHVRVYECIHNITTDRLTLYCPFKARNKRDSYYLQKAAF